MLPAPLFSVMERGLETYWQKRHFDRTSEPRGKKRRSDGFSFVVQKHAARRLHYDFRLELDGVLLSWAVPKGPSLDPSIKRLAVQTEDHPVEYGSFEGVIPKGEYGAGAVVIWDQGRWIPEGDPRESYARGRLTFRLEGTKLHGSFHLVRTRGDDGRSWLLIKRNDEAAAPGSDAHVVDDNPDSAVSGRSIAAVASAPERTWHSNRPAAAKRPSRARAARKSWPDPREVDGARVARMPDDIAPQLATLVAEAPTGDDWVHEIKLDGYRMLARCEKGRVAWITRGGHDWSERVPSLSRELASLALPGALLDGELVVLRDGVSSFQDLQNSLSEGRDARCVFYVFDLLHFGRHDLRGATLLERKAFLGRVLEAAGAATPESRIRLSEHVLGRGEEFLAGACELGAEGSVCKRADAPYASGRSRRWLKVKCSKRQEFVIGGFTAPGGARSHLGALLLGVQGDEGLAYAGKVGTGFSQRSLAELSAKLAPLVRERPAFANPPRGAEARGVRWVEPTLVAEVQFAERTSDGRVRHASFLGLREDKPARQVREERPAPPPPRKPLAKRTKRAARAQPALPTVRLTHPDRVLYAKQGITKADLALYYAQVAERMLPHVARRPLMVVRCPRGQGAECFYQKHPGKGMSAAIRRAPIEESEGVLESMYVEDVQGLLQLVQIGALEIHAWGCHVDDVERPDQLTFDLDPDEGLPWKEVMAAARELDARLERLGLTTFLKTTGGKGLHLVVPIEPSAGWDEVKQFCKDVAEAMVRQHPDRYLVNISKAKRRGKILIDYLRNGRGATAVCPYSTRAREGAPVALPIAWTDLTARLRPDRFRVENTPAHIARAPDPWAHFETARRPLAARLLRAAAT
jgi:bifunctional non-homologous end joining protein LigD